MFILSLFQAISQVTKGSTDSSVKVNTETGFSDAFRALGFNGQIQNKAEPVAATAVEKVKVINKKSESKQKTVIPPKIEEIKVCTEIIKKQYITEINVLTSPAKRNCEKKLKESG